MISHQKVLWNKEYDKNESKWNKETKGLLNILKGKTVLELGVGNGKTLKSIMRQKPKEVFAIDFSKNAIEICKRSFNYKNIRFLIANLEKLPFDLSKFDVIVCYYVLNNLRKFQMKKCVKEINRVLKEGGIVIFEDFAKGDLRELTRKKKKSYNRDELFCHFFDVKELNGLFSKFSKKKFNVREFKPFRTRDETRRIISGFVKK